jgi:hypothetical protein
MTHAGLPGSSILKASRLPALPQDPGYDVGAAEAAIILKASRLPALPQDRGYDLGAAEAAMLELSPVSHDSGTRSMGALQGRVTQEATV